MSHLAAEGWQGVVLVVAVTVVATVELAEQAKRLSGGDRGAVGDGCV